MKIRHQTALTFSGFSWLAIGSLLIYRGIKYLAITMKLEEGGWLLSLFSTSFYSHKGVIFALGIMALILGWIKGRYVFSKTVNRVASRIARLSSPFPLRQIYTPGYFFLIIAMSSLGMCFRFFPLSSDIKGFLDLTIGTALIIGGGLYFRRARSFLNRHTNLSS